MKEFKKRIYTFQTYRKDVAGLMKAFPALKQAKKAQRIPDDFATRIMLAVTSVNGCRYCSWFHSRQALKQGTASVEIREILEQELGQSVREEETVALLFAQHYAETNRKPDPESVKRLYDYYGKEKAEDILLNIRFIFWGNLSGNTFDAFLSRFKGERAHGSNLLFEFVFFIIHFPFLAPLLPAMKQKTGQ